MLYSAVHRVVLDSSVVISAFRSRHGAANAVMDLVASRQIVPLATPALFLEYEEVLKRPEQRSVSGLTLAEIDRTLAALAAALEPVDVRFIWRPQLSDPDDEMVLEAAVNGRADALVTHNLADFEAIAPKFGLLVVRPADLLGRVRG
ncbi:putative toxin-antitoxin system toxin component, PIN family [Lichenicoccus sp.]|uniref:putative toxin-antitoxin system toxin component, PIN family n=1 Tax=Lichenicoccus sp. TaxID=2781899 RepID=UPI003D0DDC3A